MEILIPHNSVVKQHCGENFFRRWRQHSNRGRALSDSYRSAKVQLAWFASVEGFAVARQRSLWRLLLVPLLLLPIGYGLYQLSRHVWAARQFHAAEAAVARRDFATASRLLDDCLRIHPGDSETLLLAAQVARRRGAFDEASRRLHDCRQANVVPEAIDLERKLLRLQTGDLEEAATYLRYCAAEPAAPQTPAVLEALIVGGLSSMNLPVARLAIELWLEHQSGDTDQQQGFLWRGDLALRSGDWERALRDYRRAFDLDPAQDDARRRLADLLVRYSPREAFDLLGPLLARRPDDPTLQLLLARCHRALGELEQTRAILDPLLEQSPNQAALLLERGLLALDLLDSADAERLLRRAERLNPDSRDVNLALVRCLRLGGKEAEADRYQARLAAIDRELQLHIDKLFPSGPPKK